MLLIVTSIINAVIAASAAVLAIIIGPFDKRENKRARRYMAAFLSILAITATAVYLHYNSFRFGIGVHTHDVFHYYLGAKYSPELGYSNLYRCALIADMEDMRLFDHPNIRNLDDYSFEPVAHVLKNKELYKKPFSDARWQEFKKDVAYFQGQLDGDADGWQRMLRDKGYNATPVWNMTARFLANRFPTDKGGVETLIYLDIMLIGFMLGMTYAAFGRRTTLFAIIFFATNFFMSSGFIKSSYLRLDWVTMLVMAICLIRAKRYKTAGAIISYAATARIFPVIFVFGMGARALWNLIETRKLDRKYIGFFATFAIGAVLLIAISIFADGGIQYWTEFFRKIALHDTRMSVLRVGFKYVFIPFYGPLTAQTFNEHQTMWWTIQSVVLLMTFLATRNIEDYESIPLGFVPVFFLVAPTFYYQVMLIVPLFLFAPKLDRPTRSTGLALLFLISATLHILGLIWERGRFQSLLASYMLMGFAAYILAVSIAGGPRNSRTDPESGIG